jgi:Ser/Thr protein kinase RdoA (MazF antagonist)
MMMNDIGHYDLHSENVLVGKTCKIIDFGNYKKPGIWISDLLYFYSTIYASFSSNDIYQKKNFKTDFFIYLQH